MRQPERIFLTESGLPQVAGTRFTETGHLQLSGPEQGLDGTALVHGPVSLGRRGQRQLEVEDLARVDGLVLDELNEAWRLKDSHAVERHMARR